eukprot:4750001-Amphidinium_carterae.1
MVLRIEIQGHKSVFPPSNLELKVDWLSAEQTRRKEEKINMCWTPSLPRKSRSSTMESRSCRAKWLCCQSHHAADLELRV